MLDHCPLHMTVDNLLRENDPLQSLKHAHLWRPSSELRRSPPTDPHCPAPMTKHHNHRDRVLASQPLFPCGTRSICHHPSGRQSWDSMETWLRPPSWQSTSQAIFWVESEHAAVYWAWKKHKKPIHSLFIFIHHFNDSVWNSSVSSVQRNHATRHPLWLFLWRNARLPSLRQTTSSASCSFCGTEFA